jgi:hypothetical protein
MAKARWKAKSTVKWDDRPFLTRYRIPMAVAVILAAVIGVLYYRYVNSDYQYGDTSTDYERAITKCMEDRTRASDSGDAVDEAASACVRETPGGK